MKMAGFKMGLTLGKFAPFHKGHEELFDAALSEMDKLIILIYEADETEIPLSVRARWLRNLYPQAEVIEAWDGPQQVGDTAEIKAMHEKYILKKLDGRKITHFYSAEFYGHHVSQALGAIDRRLTRMQPPISGTMIRTNPFKYRSFMEPLVYHDLITKVVFLGAPSTGKSTIAKQLAVELNTVFMPEYGREYWEKNQVARRLEPGQLVEIAEGHIRREDQLTLDANRYIFVDTNAITTYMFALDYHGLALPQLELLALKASTRYDLIFLCADDIPYDNTWDRSGEVKRYVFQKKIIADLKERRLPYIELKGDLNDRVSIVKKVLEKFNKYSNPGFLSELSGKQSSA
jgi:HTH-type transcriptional regulator, transcriptional repressor of NAD biosynthesis genes